jgi:lysophospholipase L1-like esterase
MDRRRNRWLLFLGIVSALCSLSAQERRSILPGRSPSPLFDKNGRFIIAYQNSDNGLGLAAGDSAAQSHEAHDLTVSPPALSPVIKKDKSDEIGIVWEEHGRGNHEIYFGRLDDGRLVTARSVVQSDHPLFSPDLDFDDRSNPWITWIQCADQKYSVCVASLGLNKTWVVNAPYFASALNPKLLAGGNGEIWAFWTGQNGGRDEIFGRVFQGNAWSEIFKLNGDSRYPHTSQSVGLDANGFPWVVWSAYGGRDYEIFVSSWNGESWSPEEKITDNGQADLSPAIAFVHGTIPLVLWSRTSGPASALYARYKQGYDWSPEIQVIQTQNETLRSPKIAVLDDRLAMTWESGEAIRSFSLLFRDLAEKASLVPGTQTLPPVLNAGRDENQYTGFGDSITGAENQGYIPRLEALLIQKYGTAKVWNEGVGGETTLEGLARIDSAIAARQSKYMLLMEGTNDIIFLEISTDTAAFNLEQMASRCLFAGMTPLVATIIPRNDWHWYYSIYQNRIFDLNSKIRQFSNPLNFPLVDQFNAFYDYPASQGGWQSLLLDDGVHPNAKGYQVMAETWFEGLKNQKDTLTVTSPNGGESWEATSVHNITWTTQGTVGNVGIEYSTNGGTSYTEIVASAPNNGTYSWTVPNTPSSNCLVRISETSSGMPSDVSNAAFAITPPPKPKAPLSPAIDTRLDSTETKKINKITWQANPENAGITLKNYKLYKKQAGQADSSFSLLASPASTTLQYEDTNLDIKTNYSYRVTALSQYDSESDPSGTVTDSKKFEFPPLNPDVWTVLIRILSAKEKFNTISFEKNALNDESEVSGYNVYRRKAEEGDDKFAPLAALSASRLRYRDTRLPKDQKYAYAVTTVYTDGRESRKSAVVTDM